MMRVRPLGSGDDDAWDRFCADACNATFLHTRRFLSYHGDRFVDRSLVVEDDRGWLAVLPAAQDPADPAVVVSHPGITYGGFVHQGTLRGERAVEALALAARHYTGLGLRTLRYKALPHIYQRAPAQDDLYALFRAGARRWRCDLSCCIDLAHRLLVSERRRRGVSKAMRAGVRLADGIVYAAALWPVLEDNLMRRHGVRPVHTLQELETLADRFREQIRFHVALVDDQVIAGVVLFACGTVVHAQYIAASEQGHALSALDAVFEAAIADAAQQSARWFDFGISTEDHGWRLNEGLYRFKSEFGGGGVVHEFYEIDLA